MITIIKKDMTLMAIRKEDFRCVWDTLLGYSELTYVIEGVEKVVHTHDDATLILEKIAGLERPAHRLEPLPVPSDPVEQEKMFDRAFSPLPVPSDPVEPASMDKRVKPRTGPPKAFSVCGPYSLKEFLIASFVVTGVTFFAVLIAAIWGGL